MKNYSNIVLSIITKNGEQIDLSSSPEDIKHISAYSRLIKLMSNDIFNIKKFIEQQKNKGSITGFEIAKFIASQGNIVFFHTDVNNAYLNKKEASIISHESITINQKNKLKEMIECLKEFKIYLGKVSKTNKGHFHYERTTLNQIISSVNDSNTNQLKETSLFEENIIYIISPNGELTALPKKEKESNHKSAYTRLKEIKPELFTDCDILGGYETACILAANDKVVIWPTNINKADIIIITMPKLMDNNQCKTLKQLLPLLNSNILLYSVVARYKKRNSKKIILEQISESGNYSEGIKKTSTYLDKIIKINEMIDSESFILDIDAEKLVNKNLK